MPEAYESLVAHLKDIGRLGAIEALLEWDLQTYMPGNGMAGRAEALALLAGLKHDRSSSEAFGKLLANVRDNGNPVHATNVREARRIHERAIKVPTELIKRISHTATHAHDAWLKARRAKDFGLFLPLLEQMIELKRQQADALGYDNDPYDALLDEFEPGATTAEVSDLFDRLRRGLVPFVQAIASSPRQPDTSILTRSYPPEGQKQLGLRFVAQMGFDFESGRLDVSTHPFCTTIAAGDVRITTRYEERFLPAAVFSMIHEAGHGLYEQGLPGEHVFTPAGSAVSLGIHESQSRLWENIIGRSRPFWEYHFETARNLFPDTLSDVSLDDFHAAINAVRPTPIRVEADEVTYSLHVILRFELERNLLSGALEPRDLPEAWNRKMTEIVGVTPASDVEGCLQDIHWSAGAFGYFPTYTLGNLYAAQFYAAACRALPDLEQCVRSGDLAGLGTWLRDNIYRQGKRYRAAELCHNVTGQPLDIDAFMHYIEQKYRPLYGIADARR